ncbi:hypothetical protein AB8A05_00660 [Tardiphaga sp. 538_B7_N1_4]|uniref:hypothetical protein n=1 Tax=Tardiphaga sp. 538_B7_N1_4 TaxID=3240778 RepID=UPI003F28DC5D
MARAAISRTEPRATEGYLPSYAELAFLLAASIFAFIYYGDAYRLGFDWGDMGSYAQYVRELTLGAKFGDAVGYGPLWYFLGIGVFRVWGAHFGAVLAVFQIVIFASACLIWLAARKASGSAIAAGIAFLCVLCVPPFYASAIRMLSLALFAYPLICFARAENGREFWPLAATAAAIGVNFALRPDFGYLYTAALGILLMLRAWQTPSAPAARLGYLLKMIAVSAVIILLTLSPVILHAAFDGYLQPFLADLLSYPWRLLFFLSHAGGMDDVIKDSGKQTASFLKILPLGALIHGTLPQRIFSFLIYSSSAVLVVVGLNLACRLVLVPAAAADNRLRLSLLMIAAVQWPGFALFRPDWVHFISFMHAYTILVVCVALWLSRDLTSTSPVRRLLKAAAVVVIAVQMGLFVAYGVFIDDSGWGPKQAQRDTVFAGRNGVRQFVSADQKRLYTDIFELIEQNSKPGDRIVCVPYCAGFAFMTDRRLLFKEHYVDDGTPLLYPGWIDRAIALTLEVRPPVVIVLDWAPNHTEISRFDVWAARYMDYIRRTYARSVSFGMGTVWIRDPAPATPERREAIVAYGPEKAAIGVPFNRQPSGESAIWTKLSAPAGIGAAILLDDLPLKTFVDGTAVSALVPADLLIAEGRHWLKVVNTNTGLVTNAVPFDVTAAP